MSQTVAQAIVHKTKQHFARYGIPDRLYTDNWLQFDCTEFTRFAYEWKFEHHTSLPYHSQSKGLIKAAVKAAKSLQKKVARAKKDQWLSFLDYRNTSTEEMDSSPVQRLICKRTKTTLPVAQHLLEPEIQTDVETKLTRKRQMATKYYDRGSKELPELEIGQPIRMMQSPTKKKWRRGVCADKVAQRSYVVEVDGSTYRRNRKSLCRAEDSGLESLQVMPTMQAPQPLLDLPSSAEDSGPKPLQGTPTMQTPLSLLDLPSSAEQVSNKANTPIAPLGEQPAQSSGGTTQLGRKLPPTTPPTPPLQPTMKMTCSGRVSKPPIKLNI